MDSLSKCGPIKCPKGQFTGDCVFYTGPNLSNGINNGDSFNTVIEKLSSQKQCTDISIILNPSDTTIIEGSILTLSVVANGSDIKYQWYKDGFAISGATNATYSVTSAISDSGVYYVQLTNDCSSSTSTTATVVVNSACVPPNITSQPISKTVYSGTDVVFNVVAEGDGLTYRWYKNGNLINNQNTNELLLSAVDESVDGDTYFVVVDGACGSVTSNTVSITIQYNLEYAFVDSIADLDSISYNNITITSASTSVAIPAPLVDGKYVVIRNSANLPDWKTYVVSTLIPVSGTFTSEDTLFTAVQTIGAYKYETTLNGYFTTDSSATTITITR